VILSEQQNLPLPPQSRAQARDPYSYDDLCKEIELMKTRDQIRGSLGFSIEARSDDLAIWVSSPTGDIDPDLSPGL
jgi:hypothetical protein